MTKKSTKGTKATGLESLVGEKVILMCMNYHYVGTLAAVSKDDAVLDAQDAAVCYETGEWGAKEWKDAQKVGHQLYVRLAAIESYFASGK